MELRPIALRDARRFVGEHHRHNEPPHAWLFGTKVVDDAGETVGVGIAARPARQLQDGYTVCITRVCTDGSENACSVVYGALCRAAKALGYRRAVTYITKDEPGTSLKAAGFVKVADTEPGDWNSPSRPRVTHTLFGPRAPEEPKERWERQLVARPTPQPDTEDN